MGGFGADGKDLVDRSAAIRETSLCINDVAAVDGMDTAVGVEVDTAVGRGGVATVSNVV